MTELTAAQWVTVLVAIGGGVATLAKLAHWIASRAAAFITYHWSELRADVNELRSEVKEIRVELTHHSRDADTFRADMRGEIEALKHRPRNGTHVFTSNGGSDA